MFTVLTTPLRAMTILRAIAGELSLVSSLTGAIEELHTELAGMRSDLSSMPADTRRLADDVEIVDEKLGILNIELTQIKESISPVHGDLERVQEGLAPLPDGLDALLRRVADLAERLDGMRGEVAGEVDALRTDLSSLPFVSKS